MATINHEAVKEVRGYIRKLSADEEARRLAFVRERAQRDEATLLKEAEARGEVRGREEGVLLAKRDILKSLIQLKFGDQPEWFEAQLNAADKIQLDRWVADILTAESLEVLFSE